MTTKKTEEEIKLEKEFHKWLESKMEYSRNLHEYDINTNTIYDELRDKWQNYDKDLLDTIKEAIHHVHYENKIMTYRNDGSEIAQGKIEGQLKHMLGKDGEISPDEFPIEYYYLGGIYNNMEYIVCMIEACKVGKEQYRFDLLFAVQYSLTPINECDGFLHYQLGHNFGNNPDEFKVFMDNICLEYNSFLKDKHEVFYNRFMDKKLLPELKKAGIVKLTWNGQSNSLTYLFRQLKNEYNKEGEPIISDSYEDIAHFIQNHFAGFENVKLSTLVGQLKKTDKPKKAFRKIELYI